jgi:hypothetical protein
MCELTAVYPLVFYGSDWAERDFEAVCVWQGGDGGRERGNILGAQLTKRSQPMASSCIVVCLGCGRWAQRVSSSIWVAAKGLNVYRRLFGLRPKGSSDIVVCLGYSQWAHRVLPSVWVAANELVVYRRLFGLQPTSASYIVVCLGCSQRARRVSSSVWVSLPPLHDSANLRNLFRLTSDKSLYRRNALLRITEGLYTLREKERRPAALHTRTLN